MTCRSDAKTCWKVIAGLIVVAAANIVLLKSVGIIGIGLAISAGALGPASYAWLGIVAVRLSNRKRRRKKK